MNTALCAYEWQSFIDDQDAFAVMSIRHAPNEYFVILLSDSIIFFSQADWQSVMDCWNDIENFNSL